MPDDFTCQLGTPWKWKGQIQSVLPLLFKEYKGQSLVKQMCINFSFYQYNFQQFRTILLVLSDVRDGKSYQLPTIKENIATLQNLFPTSMSQESVPNIAVVCLIKQLTGC